MVWKIFISKYFTQNKPIYNIIKIYEFLKEILKIFFEANFILKLCSMKIDPYVMDLSALAFNNKLYNEVIYLSKMLNWISYFSDENNKNCENINFFDKNMEQNSNFLDDFEKNILENENYFLINPHLFLIFARRGKALALINDRNLCEEVSNYFFYLIFYINCNSVG